jgi:hypothetical protein
VSATNDDIWSAISKAGVALAFTTVAGAIATGGFKLIDERRARDHERRRIYREVLEAYNEVKSTRRRLRAVGLAKEKTKPLQPEEVKELRSIMLELSNAQLRFELILKECRQSDLFIRNDLLIKELRTVECFLNKAFVEKWEEYGGEVREGVNREVLQNLKFDSFLAKSKYCVSLPLDQITQIIQAELFGKASQVEASRIYDPSKCCEKLHSTKNT